MYATALQLRRAGSLSDVTALILAGGLGTRLRSVVADRSKTMACVHGRPFLEYLLKQLDEAGVRHAVLCTGHLGDSVRECLGESYGGLRLEYSREFTPLGTAGALRLAVGQCRSDVTLVMNGDSFCDADLGVLWTAHCAGGAEGTLLLTNVPDASRYGSVLVDADAYVARFEEKGAHNGPGWVNAGVYLFATKLLMTIRSWEPVSLEREMLPAWAARRLRVYRGTGKFLDIGTPESYALAERFFAREMVG